VVVCGSGIVKDVGEVRYHWISLLNSEIAAITVSVA
jgi:hypothetical protein